MSITLGCVGDWVPRLIKSALTVCLFFGFYLVLVARARCLFART